MQFVGVDATTRGSWKGSYGTEGYHVVNDLESYPSYAAVQPAGQSVITYQDPSDDFRALQKSNSSDRIAAAWYASEMSIDVNFTDGQAHRVTLYVLDWGYNGRSEQIEIIDPVTNQVLDGRAVSNYAHGKYLAWNLSGGLRIKITNAGPENAVINGIFFDPAATPLPQPPTYTISGTIADSSGTPLSNVPVAVSGSTVSYGATTGGDGRYSVPNVIGGADYVVMPLGPSAPFTPTNRMVSYLSSSVVADFTGTALLSGNGRIAFASSRGASVGISTINEDGSGRLDIPNGFVNQTSPAWSPDGNRIAFVKDVYAGGNYRQKLFVMNSDGTDVIQITDGLRAGRPAWSPDGSKIAFADQPENAFVRIFVVNSDGSNPIQITSENNNFAPAWSPDGSKIAFVSERDFDREIYVMNADGSNQTRLTSAPQDDLNPAWSLDGSRIAFDSYRDFDQEIYVMNADGSGQLNLTNSEGIDSEPAWSPSGTKIAFSRFREGNGGIYMMNVDGSNLVALTNTGDAWPAWTASAAVPSPTPTPTPAADMYVYGSASPNYVPSGGQVTYQVNAVNSGPDPAVNVTVTGQLPAGVTFNSIADNGDGTCAGIPGGASFDCTFDTIDASERKTISVLATATGTPYELISTTFNVTSSTPDSNPDNNTSGAQFYIASPPVPTPTPGPVNELQLGYTTFDQATFQGDIFRQRADGAQLLNLTNSPADERGFMWSPDGSKLAFARYDFTNLTASSYVMAADGSNLVQLTNVPGEYISAMIWSPNGSKLIFSVFPYSNDTPDGQIYVINADGTGRVNVSGMDGFNTDPAWSPDGTKISFMRSHSFTDGSAPTNDLYVANANGTNPIRIAHAAGERDFGPLWSPDGTRLAFTRILPDNTIQAFTVRPDGSDTRRIVNDPDTQTFTPQWSPDGRLSFSSLNYTTFASAIEAANFDGSGRVTIYSAPQGGLYYGLNGWTWSPDGSRLALSYIIGEAQGANVCVVNADGTGLRCIGNSDQEYNNAPDWSPDGALLAFISNRNGVRTIDLVNADGAGRVELTRAEASGPKWRPVPQGNTPAGANVTVTSNGVTLTFSNVTQAGQTTVTPIDPNSLSGVPGEYVIDASSLAFEIHTTAVYTGPITLGFQVPSVNNPITFSALRVLHGEPLPVPNYVDRTVLPPDTPAPDFATRTIYARVTSLSPFVIAELRPNLLTALGPAQVWIGLKNSDDVGTKFDLLAEVFKNGTLIGSGQLNNVVGGSSGFNNARLNAISLALSGTPAFGPGNTLSIQVSVRIAASSGHRSGTARLWFNDTAANSRFGATIGGVPNNYYLRKLSNSLVLTTATGGTAKITIDVLVDRAVGGNPFKPFGTWSVTF